MQAPLFHFIFEKRGVLRTVMTDRKTDIACIDLGAGHRCSVLFYSSYSVRYVALEEGEM